MKYAVIILICLPILALAQRKDSVVLEEVLIRDKRLFEKETAGGKQTRIDTLVLSEHLNHTLSELLVQSTPIFIKAYGRGSLATASFRGTAPSHAQVLWNGMSINSPMLGMVDFSLLPVYFIDDVSLKHGGASTEDIGGALGGSINISNKPDWKNTLSTRYVQGIGSFGTTEEFADFKIGNQKLQARTRAYYTWSDNDFPFDNDEIIGKPRMRNRNGFYEMYSVMQELYYKINPRNQVSANAWWHVSDRSIAKLNSDESKFDSNISLMDDRTLRMTATWDHHYAKGTITLSSGLQDQDLDFHLMQNISGLGKRAAIESISTSKSYINRFQIRHDFSDNASLNIRINYNYHIVDNFETVKKTGYHESRKEVLMYAGYHYTLWERLNLRASIREDYVSDLDNPVIPIVPYLGFDVKLFHDQTIYLKGNIVRNYHVPTLNDLYFQPGGNPNLVPEHGITRELTLAHEMKSVSFNVESQITGFHSDIRDWILWIPNFRGTWEPLNVRKVIAKGFEFATKVKWKQGNYEVTVNGNYAYTQSLNYGDKKTWGDESRGKQLVYIPVHSGNAFINARYKTWSVTWQHTTYSKRFTTSSNDKKKIGMLPDYFMNDLYVSKSFTLNNVTFEAQFKIYNLFDEYYRSVLARRMPERNYMLLLMIRYAK